METITSARVFVRNTDYLEQRQIALNKLDLSTIDPPIVDIIHGVSQLYYCFTLQSCVGHFLYPGVNNNPHNTESLPDLDISFEVHYRIAYLAFCIQESYPGKELFDQLAELPFHDPQYIQFGSADWFWERQPNSYVLQVEPARYKTQDECTLDYSEALHVEQVRNHFFRQIRNLLRARLEAEEI